MDSKLKKDVNNKTKKDSAKNKQKKSTKSATTIAKEQIADEEVENEREGKSEMSPREIFDRSRNVASRYKGDSEPGSFTTSKDAMTGGFFGDSYFGKENQKDTGDEFDMNNVSDAQALSGDVFAELSGFDKKMRVLDIKAEDKERKYGRMDSAEKAEKAKDYNLLSTSVKKIQLCKKVIGRMDRYSQEQSVRDSFDIAGVRNKYDKIRFNQEQVNFSIRRKHIDETPNGIADEVYKKLKVYADDEVNAYKGYSLGKNEMDVDI